MEARRPSSPSLDAAISRRTPLVVPAPPTAEKNDLEYPEELLRSERTNEGEATIVELKFTLSRRVESRCGLTSAERTKNVTNLQLLLLQLQLTRLRE